MEVKPQPTCKRTKKLTSLVWNDFERVKKDGCMVAICNHCRKRLSGSSTSGTSHLRNHLKRCLRRVNTDTAQKLVVVREKKRDGTTNLRNLKLNKEQTSLDFKFDLPQNQSDVKFDQEQSRSDLARMIIMHGYPLSMVENVGFRNFLLNLQPLFQLESAKITRVDCLQIHQIEKQKLYEKFNKVSSRISLTAELWSSYQDNKYLCLTAHYIDEAWQLQKKILNFIAVHSCTEEALSDAIMICMMEWNISHNLFSTTLDNCSMSDNSVFRVRERLSHTRLILCNGQLFHVRCAAHILYLLVADLIEALHEITHKIRESIRYVKSSDAMEQKFGDMALSFNTHKSLSLDFPTKWDSTYHMLEAAVEHRDAFSSLQECDSGFTMVPSTLEWDRATIVTDCLKLFYDITNFISGVKCPTANLYFPEICDVHLQLIKWCDNSDVLIEVMAFKMKIKFDVYWSVSNLTLAITAVLDPRFKMKLVEYYYQQIYGTNASERVEEVLHVLRDLYNEYALHSTSASGDQGLACETQSSSGHGGIFRILSNDSRDRLSGFDKFLHETSDSLDMDSDLENYLEEPVFPRNMDFDILNWWKVNSPKYPILSILARDVLGVPMSINFTSGSASGTGGKMLDSHQSSLGPDILQALICTHDWLQTELGD